MFCPNCGSKLPEGTAFCSGCGAKLQPPAPNICASCGAQMPSDADFCISCGAAKGSKAAAPPPTQGGAACAPQPSANIYAQQSAACGFLRLLQSPGDIGGKNKNSLSVVCGYSPRAAYRISDCRTSHRRASFGEAVIIGVGIAVVMLIFNLIALRRQKKPMWRALLSSNTARREANTGAARTIITGLTRSTPPLSTPTRARKRPSWKSAADGYMIICLWATGCASIPPSAHTRSTINPKTAISIATSAL